MFWKFRAIRLVHKVQNSSLVLEPSRFFNLWELDFHFCYVICSHWNQNRLKIILIKWFVLKTQLSGEKGIDNRGVVPSLFSITHAAYFFKKITFLDITFLIKNKNPSPFQRLIFDIIYWEKIASPPFVQCWFLWATVFWFVVKINQQINIEWGRLAASRAWVPDAVTSRLHFVETVIFLKYIVQDCRIDIWETSENFERKTLVSSFNQDLYFFQNFCYFQRWCFCVSQKLSCWGFRKSENRHFWPTKIYHNLNC